MKKIFLTGNVGKNPEIRSSQNGDVFATFSLAVSVGTKQSPKTDWIEISCNNKLVEVARTYIKSGDKLFVEGFPSVHAYINKNNEAVATMRVSAMNIEFLGGSKEEPIKQDLPF